EPAGYARPLVQSDHGAGVGERQTDIYHGGGDQLVRLGAERQQIGEAQVGGEVADGDALRGEDTRRQVQIAGGANAATAPGEDAAPCNLAVDLGEAVDEHREQILRLE